jgi:predicted HicB family RNase H-like nuclease
MPKQKPKKAGRPKLPKGNAKGVMLRVRVTPEDRKAIEAKSKTENQSVSQWIRSTLAAAVES